MKNHLKSCFLVMLCLVMVLSAAACGKNDADEALSDEVLGVEIVGGDDDAADDPADANADNGDAADPSGENTNTDGTNTTNQSGKKTNNSGTGNQTSAGTKKSGVKTTKDGKQIVNNCYISGYPIAKDKVTLKIMCVDYSGGADYSKMAFTKFVEQKFNVKLEFSTITSEQSVEKVTLAYSSGTMPDMFWGIGLAGTNVHYNYAKEGRCLNLQDYMDYMPNLQAVFKEEPQAKYACTYPDGKIYTAPLVRKDNLTTDPLYINKTWLSKVGLGMPKTTTELTNVLRAFKNNDPNGNGKKDEIPMAFVEDVPYGFYGIFGLSTYNSYTLDSSGKVVYPFITNEYRSTLKYLSGLYSEGLLYNTEIRNFTAPKAKAMIDASVPLIGIVNASSYSSVMSSDRFVKDYTIMPIIDGTGSGKATWGYKNTEQLWANWGVITSNCKYPEIAARLLDYFYSEEGTAVATYGPPGEKLYWNYDKDGKPVYNNNNLSFTTLTPGHAVPRYVRNKTFFTNDLKGKTDADTTARKAQQALKDKYFSGVKPGYYGVTLTEKEKETVSASSNSNLLMEVAEWRMQFLVGKRNIDSEWEPYVKTINGMGIEKALPIYQKAYQRQQAAIK